MDTILGNRPIWQVILAFATDGAFILDVPRDDGIVLTHPLAALRKTCKAMRDMIPAPAGITPYDMFALGANIGNLALCEFAYQRLPRFVKKHWKCKTDGKVQKKISRMLAFTFEKVACDGHLRVIEFALNTPFRDNFCAYKSIENAAVNGHWDVCDVLLSAYPHYEFIAMEAAGFQNRADIIDKLKLRGVSCRSAFVGASCAGHVDLCEAMLAKGDITLEDALWSFKYGDDKVTNIDVLAFHRKCAKKFGRSVSDFYNNMMLSYARNNDEQVLRLLRAWSIEDGIRPWYGAILHQMDDNVLDGARINARTFQLIRDFARD